MKRFLIAAIAVFAITILFNSNSDAQTYGHGYRYGAGLSQAFGTGSSHIGFRGIRGRRGIGINYGGFGYGGFGFGTGGRVEGQPFFAVNPPVYYSGIVRRPYGISPFPAPAGILPAEMQVPQAQPITISNPFFNEAMPASETLKAAKEGVKNKTTKTGPMTIRNQYIAPEVQIQGQVGFASLESVIEEN